MQPNSIKKPFKIIIVGAGAAGYFAAAAIRRNCPHIDVTIVHDPQTPYLAVGESLGWNGRDFMKDMLGLGDDHSWMPESHSTYKFAIKHVGFNGDPDAAIYGTHFWNPTGNVMEKSIISTVKSTNDDILNSPLSHHSLVDIWMHLYKKGLRHEHTFGGDLAELHWYCKNDTMPWDSQGQAYHHYNKFTQSYHINADHIKDVVHKLVGIPNGVKTIPIRVKQVKVVDDRITGLVLDNDEELTADLYFDCTGFQRVLLKQLSFKWNPCDEYFNNASLLGNPEYPDGDYPHHAYTEHHAMKYGWAFTIPADTRMGNGYQFNRNIFDKEDQILADFEQKFPDRKNIVIRSIKWEPGFHDKIFSENCIALGISHGFADVFDANNFSTHLGFIYRLVNFLKDDPEAKFEWRKTFNEYATGITEDVKLRIQTVTHLAPKNDSVYWQEMKIAAKKFNTLERINSAMLDDKRRFFKPSNICWWLQTAWAHHAIYYNLPVNIPTLDISPRDEQIACNFFDYFNNHNRITAESAIPIKDFYQNFYNR
jgi:Tryptophan halogenase